MRLPHAIVLFAFLPFAPSAHAATNFTPSVTVADGQLDTVLTWDSDRTQCEGTGHPAWDGPKEPAGSMQLPTIDLSGTYTLTLTCRTLANMTARVTWVPPTRNTDGTTLTNLAGYRIVYGRDPKILVETLQISNPSVTSHLFDDLATGSWFFAAYAYNSSGAESVLSNIASKTLTAEALDEESVTLTVNPVPESLTIDIE